MDRIEISRCARLRPPYKNYCFSCDLLMYSHGTQKGTSRKRATIGPALSREKGAGVLVKMQCCLCVVFLLLSLRENSTS